jgi:branched-chain amino acid transport system substrate-binding protein
MPTPNRTQGAIASAALLLSLLLPLLLGAGCAGGGPVTVGFSGQLTGVHSDLGVGARNGVQLAVERVNEDGGVAGKRIKLAVGNDRNSPEGALEADERLIDAGAAAIIGHMTSSQTLAALPLLKRAGVPLVSPTASTPILSGKRDLFFRLTPASDMNARVMGRYAFSDLGAERLGIVYDTSNEAYSLPYADTFAESVRSGGAEVALRVAFSAKEEVAWERIVERLSQAGCDTVLVIAAAAETALFAQAAADSPEDFVMMGTGWAYTENLMRYGGAAVDGMYFTDIFDKESRDPEYLEFVSDYETRYGAGPNFAALLGYESLMFVRKGLEETGGRGEGLEEALAGIRSMEGFTGTLEFDRYGDVFRPFFITRIAGGGYTTVDRIDAGTQRAR